MGSNFSLPPLPPSPLACLVRVRGKQERLEAKRAARISFQKKLPKVNTALAQRLLKAAKRDKADDKAAAAASAEEEAPPQPATAPDASNPLGDARFASLFTREDFQVDEESEEFKLRNPNGIAAHPGGKRRRKRRDGSDSEGDGSDDDLVVRSAFRPVQEQEEEEKKDGGGRAAYSSSDSGGDDDDDEVEVGYREGSRAHQEQPWRAKQQQQQQRRRPSQGEGPTRRKPMFMEADSIVEDGRAMLLHDQSRRRGAKALLKERQVPLAERLQQQQKKKKAPAAAKQASSSKLVKLSEQQGGGMVREFTFIPGQKRGQEGAAGGGGRRGNGEMAPTRRRVEG